MMHMASREYTRCKGEPESHIYSYTFPDGERITSCGVYATKIPEITIDDVNEINKHCIGTVGV